MEFKKFATMIQGHGCVPQTNVEFKCKCNEILTTPLFAVPLIGEDHQCQYATDAEEIPNAKMSGKKKTNTSAEDDEKSTGSNKSNKSNKSRISALSDGMIDNNKFYCLETACKTPKLKRFKSFQKEITWRLHMYQVGKLKVYTVYK